MLEKSHAPEAHSPEAHSPEAHSPETSRAERLAQHRRRELLCLRFNTADERRYCANANERRAHWRDIYLLSAAALIVAILMYDQWLLELPPAFMALRWQTGAGLMLPAIIAAMVMVRRPFLRPWSEYGIALAMALCSLALIQQRLVAYGWGIDVPTAISAIPVIIGLLLCRVRWLLFLPLLLVITTSALWTERLIPQPASRMLNESYSFAILMGIIVGGTWLIEYQNRLTWLRRDWLEHISSRDQLTAMLNKRAFNREYDRLFELARREQRPITVAMIYIDHFKAYNDRYGHQAGDRCLKRVAGRISDSARRGGDLVGRVGGEEFAAVWFGNSRDDALRHMAHLIEDVRDLEIAHDGTETDTAIVTISVGACWLVPQQGDNAAQVLHRADEQLYQAKLQGRDRLSVTTLGPGVPA